MFRRLRLHLCMHPKKDMDKSKGGMASPPPGWRIDPRYIECRTKRAPLMMPPSVHARIKAAAEADGVSFNSWCLHALESALREAERAKELEEPLSEAEADASAGPSR